MSKTRHIVIPIFVPHRGCPFDCIYCNQKTISGQMEEMTLEKMRSIIDSHLLSINEGTYAEIGFYGGSFTGIEQEQQSAYLKVANEYMQTGKIKGIRLSTRPDYIDKNILEYLKEYNVGTIELGVQSLDKEVLDKSCRGHSIDDVLLAARLVKEQGFILGIQTMIGLPGDTIEKDLATANMVIQLKPKIVRIYPTLVIKKTYLEEMFKNGKYTPVELNEAVDICAELLDLYESNDINVIRIGLQPTENINENSDVVAGPFHPAFRQMVESKLMLKKILKKIYENNLENEEKIYIYTGKGNISNVTGQKRNNLKHLYEKFKYKEIKVIGENKDNKYLCVKYNNIN